MRLNLVLTALTVTLLASLATADVHRIDVTMDGGQEVPPSGSTGTGCATVILDDVSGAVSISGRYSGLTGTVVAAHIHGPAPAGSNAGVMLGLAQTGGSTGTLSGGGILTSGQVTNMLAGLTYINVHSTVTPAGEVRGQILPPPAAPGTPFCFGTACPCGNNDPNAGCVNSTGSGALLYGLGSTSVAADDLLLRGTNCPPNNSGLWVMGGVTFAPISPVNSEGLICSGGLFRFIPRTVDACGVFELTGVVAMAPAGQINAGDTRYFTAWTRDVLCGPPPVPCPTPCMEGSNLTNGYEVTFTP